MKKRSDEVWKSPALAKKFLEVVRGGIPLAAEQIRVMLRLIAAQPKPVKTFLDLGCGNGILASAILSQFPKAKGLLADFSDTMLDAARVDLKEHSGNLSFRKIDYAEPQWVHAVSDFAPFDVIVSGFSIHHQPDKRKKRIYKEIYGLLKSPGLFVHIEHVSSPTKWVESVWDEYMIDSVYTSLVKRGKKISRQYVADKHYKRPDKDANILASVEDQCEWLREIGFKDVDCYLKIFELTVFGGRKRK